MKCKYCGAEMQKDDVDFNFKGNYDIYWICPKCETSCIEQYRFSQSFKEFWHCENNDKVLDEIIKKKIDITKRI